MGIIEKVIKKRNKMHEKEIGLAFREARRIAKILQQKFSAKKVILFGSLASKNYFSPGSDIDLAVTGIGDNYFKAYGHCLRECEYDLDLKPYDDLPGSFKNHIDNTGIVLYEQQR